MNIFLLLRTRKFSKIRDQSPTSPEYEPVDHQAGFDAFRKIVLAKKKINWKRSVPKKSQEQRRMSHLIAMTSASALVKGSYINITKKFDNGNELSFQGQYKTSMLNYITEIVLL